MRPRWCAAPAPGVNGVKLIIGLGNPGAEYRETRHNAGFMVTDCLAERRKWPWRLEKKFFAEIADGTLDGRRVVLAKPQTFMNLSGKAAGELARYLKAALPDVLVLVDDADLPLGSLRLRAEGSAGGHHGLESVETHLGSRAYARLRLGVARPNQGRRDIAGHVLGCFDHEELAVWKKVLQRAVGQVECWAAEGIAPAMTKFNGTVNAGPAVLSNKKGTLQ